MATRTGIKRVNGRKVAYVHSGEGDAPWERQYPECRSKAAFFEALRVELAMPASTTMKEVAQELKSKMWDGQRWVNNLDN
jgi:hypothetical protein